MNSNTAKNMLGRISERTREADGSLPGGTLNIARNTSHLREKGESEERNNVRPYLAARTHL